MEVCFCNVVVQLLKQRLSCFGGKPFQRLDALPQLKHLGEPLSEILHLLHHIKESRTDQQPKPTLIGFLGEPDRYLVVLPQQHGPYRQPPLLMRHLAVFGQFQGILKLYSKVNAGFYLFEVNQHLKGCQLPNDSGFVLVQFNQLLFCVSYECYLGQDGVVDTFCYFKSR